MTLDEAIEHEKLMYENSVGEESYVHLQYAEWLRKARGSAKGARWMTGKLDELKAENKRLASEIRLTKRMYAKVCEEKCKADAENAKLRELALRFAGYVSQDRCDGCMCKSRCDAGLLDECWQRTEIREMADGFGIEVE